MRGFDVFLTIVSYASVWCCLNLGAAGFTALVDEVKCQAIIQGMSEDVLQSSGHSTRRCDHKEVSMR